MPPAALRSPSPVPTHRLIRGASLASTLAQTRELAATVRARLRGGRVLVVDDDPVTRDLICALLAPVGIEADLAEDGQIAVHKAAAHHSLILMDIHMPILSGLEAARELRLRQIESPIIAMTAGASEADRLAYVAAGLADLIPKPIFSASLYVRLLRFMRAQATG